MPTHFYKVVYDPVNQDAIAFLVPHRKISKSDLPVFIVSVDEVEWGLGVWGREFGDVYAYMLYVLMNL